jgi:DNA-binding transcriptional ArsR family regulator
VSSDVTWKALADGTRRQILVLLRGGPLTTTAIVREFPKLSRFGVMKHISVLRDANLIEVRRQGPHRLNSLNVVPIRLIYEELVGEYEDLWAGTLTGLKRELEEQEPDGSTPPPDDGDRSGGMGSRGGPQPR